MSSLDLQHRALSSFAKSARTQGHLLTVILKPQSFGGLETSSSAFKVGVAKQVTCPLGSLNELQSGI